MIQAVDEFIEDKKAWFKDLHRQFGDEADRDIMLKVPINLNAPREDGAIDDEELK